MIFVSLTGIGGIPKLLCSNVGGAVIHLSVGASATGEKPELVSHYIFSVILLFTNVCRMLMSDILFH